MTDRPEFAPERFTNHESEVDVSVRSCLWCFARSSVGDQLKGLPDEAMEDAEALLAVQDRVLERLAPLRSGKLAASRIAVTGTTIWGRSSTRAGTSSSSTSRGSPPALSANGG